MVGVSWVKLLLGVGYIIEEVIAREKSVTLKKAQKVCQTAVLVNC